MRCFHRMRSAGRDYRLLTDPDNWPSSNFQHGALKRGRHGWMRARRAVPRRVLTSGTIEFDRGAYSCAVRNLSEAGAALDVPYAVAIPHEFTLTMDTDQVNRHCRVI